MISKQEFQLSLLPIVLKHEGGYSNIKNDKGGETYRGISKNANPDWPGWALLEPHKPLRNGDVINDRALVDSVAALYWQKYFENNGFHRCNHPLVALQLFDFSVNGGFSPLQLQKTINRLFNQTLKEDGVLGEKTYTAINDIRPDLLCHAIVNLRSEHIRRVIANDVSQSRFETGWRNRINLMRHMIKGITV
jgi:type VI secretion system secreted protein VgrG